MAGRSVPPAIAFEGASKVEVVSAAGFWLLYLGITPMRSAGREQEVGVMSTSAIAGGDRVERQDVATREVRTRAHVGRLGIGTAGVVAVLVSAWGGIVPYVGPLFNYSGDGSGSWHWSLAHAVLALAPGVLGVLLGLFVIAESRGVVVGKGRLSLATAGTLLILCGAWFAVGPLAWPVIDNGSGYFVASTHLRVLAYEVGYSIGTGLMLVMCGAFVDGWAARHQPDATDATAVTSPSAADPSPGPIESGV
jgi:hypothetical protein